MSETDLPTAHEDGAAPLSRDLLADVMLAATLGRKVRKLITTPAVAAIVVVPTASCAAAVKDALHRLADHLLVHCVTEVRHSRYGTELDVVELLANGRTLVGVTQNIELLPVQLRHAAEMTLELVQPDVSMVRRVIRKVTGSIARGLDASDIAGRTLGEIAAAIRAGSTALECVTRLCRRPAIPVPLAGNSAPPLERLPLFGDARIWAGEMQDEFAHRRAGSVVGPVEGTLLHGAAGTGKTLLAAALAQSAGVPFLATSVGEWFRSDGHLDAVLRQAQYFFDSLAELDVAVGLIDEIDAIPDRTRLANGQNREYWNVLTDAILLMLTRAVERSRGLLIIGATNHMHRIDDALKRPGRLGRHVEVRPPETPAEFEALLTYYLGGELPPAELQLAATQVGRTTPAMVAAWANTARGAARRQNRPITLSDLLTAMLPPDRRTAAERQGTAIHEAAHAVCAAALGLVVERVSILEGEGKVGLTKIAPASNTPTLAQIEDHIVAILAGRAGDVLLGHGADAGARSDLALATQLLTATRTTYGLRDTLASRGDEEAVNTLLRADSRLLATVEADLDRLMRRTMEVVSARADDIRIVADALLARSVLLGADIAQIVPSTASTDERAGGAS